MREHVLAKAFAVLQSKGFGVSSFLHTNSCFDLLAKRGKTIFLLKVFENIDALREDQARELMHLSSAFNAHSLVLGEKTKAFELRPNTVYERYSLPVVSVETFGKLLDDSFPEVKYFKGKAVVELDSEGLRKARQRLSLSLEEVADKIHSSRETLYRYEHGHSASLETAKKLEKVLKENLIKSDSSLRDFFGDFEKDYGFALDEFPEFSDSALEKIHELGLRVSVFKHAPFRAFSDSEEMLLIGRGREKSELNRKAESLQKSREMLGPHSMLVAKRFGHEKIGFIPVIREEELDSFSKGKDLLREVKKREK